MHPDDNYTTLEEHINSRRSPGLELSQPDFGDCDTPPPLVDVRENSDLSESEADGDGPFLLAPKGSKGPDYSPEIAIQASTEFITDSPESPLEDFVPDTANEQVQMIAVELGNDVSHTSSQPYHDEVLEASKKASEILNVAIGNRDRPELSFSHSRVDDLKSPVREEVMEIRDDDEPTLNDTVKVASVSSQTDNGQIWMESSLDEAGRPFNVKPPPKPSLPSLVTCSKSTPSPADSNDSLSKSPTLAKFAIHDGHPSQTLAKIQSHSPPQSSSASSPEPRQNLPSLVTALNSATDSNGTPYLDPPPSLSALTRTSTGTYTSIVGPSPSTYSQPSPMSAMSPPRLSSNPSYYRTTSQNSSVSTPAEYNSAVSATPASSMPGNSPAHSMHTPGLLPFERDLSNEMDTPRGLLSSDIAQDIGNTNGFSDSGYRCNWPGCNAAPFQTQYLLNSHTNVHSNTRSHFCPVKGCPRGPGGQGFKRKNEMIRHGLVHQSPGYVCPFCPDQQHKYPRPDNLQRHVRVHHTDKDRDDPMLREVLAQRPEGGNRGRRRRLGS